MIYNFRDIKHTCSYLSLPNTSLTFCYNSPEHDWYATQQCSINYNWKFTCIWVSISQYQLVLNNIFSFGTLHAFLALSVLVISAFKGHQSQIQTRVKELVIVITIHCCLHLNCWYHQHQIVLWVGVNPVLSITKKKSIPFHQ